MISLVENGQCLHEQVSKGFFLASGEDSRVVRNQSSIYKIYDQKGGLSVEQAREYHCLMNRASHFLEEVPTLLSLSFPPNNLSCRWSANPTQGMCTNEDGVPVAITSFVPGIRLSSFMSACVDNFKTDILQIEDAAEASYLNFFHSLFLLGFEGKSDHARRLVRTVFAAKKDLDAALADELGYDGINVVPMNVKVRCSPERGEARFIITDICADIKTLAARPNIQ